MFHIAISHPMEVIRYHYLADVLFVSAYLIDLLHSVVRHQCLCFRCAALL